MVTNMYGFSFRDITMLRQNLLQQQKFNPLTENSHFFFKLLFCVLSWAGQILAHIHLKWQTFIQNDNFQGSFKNVRIW